MINKTVIKLLNEHQGGTKFFHALDELIRKDVNILNVICGNLNFKDYYDGIILSGKFGRVFASYYTSRSTYHLFNDELIVVNGGLRKDNPIDDLSYIDLKGKNYIFVDDSFYSGKTRDIIKAEVERLGGNLVETYVVYDGSKEKDDAVNSIYRYYDNFK